MKLKRSFATLLGLALLAALVPVVALASCAAADTQITLTDFDAEGGQVYVAVEGETPRTAFTAVRRGLSCNDNRSVRVDYQLLNGTTGPPRVTIEGGNQGTLTLQAPPRSGTGTGFEASRDFIVAPGAGNVDVQHATLRLQNVGDAGLDQVTLGTPREAPVFVVDSDPTSTPFGFGMSSYRRQETFSVGIPVFRSGSVDAAGSVAFTVSGSGADPAETNDYVVRTASPLAFAAGERVQMIEIEMREDTLSESAEQLTVSLGGGGSPSSGTTQVTIENLRSSSGALRPTGALHHPKHNYKYPQNYPWLNEIHIFTSSADRDLTVRRAEMSIVKKLKSGPCRWWNGNGFVRGRCVDRRWFSDGIKHPAKDYFLHRLKQKLPLSVGKKSNVAYYEIRARWWDNRNNVSLLRVGKNQNRFEVIKPTLACKNNPFNSRKCKPIRP
jgi:hypothetical protein